MVVVALLSVYLVESVYVVSVELVVNCSRKLGKEIIEMEIKLAFIAYQSNDEKVTSK